jgi:hypothetical protein
MGESPKEEKDNWWVTEEFEQGFQVPMMQAMIMINLV